MAQSILPFTEGGPVDSYRLSSRVFTLTTWSWQIVFTGRLSLSGCWRVLLMLCWPNRHSLFFPFIIIESKNPWCAWVTLTNNYTISVNDSLLNFLPAFNLDATLLPWPEGISEDIDDFLARHPDLQDSFHFASLKIIKFSLKSTLNKG